MKKNIHHVLFEKKSIMATTCEQDSNKQRISTRACFKQRSHDTHNQTHKPQLENDSPIDIVLLGDSMFERFKTTGQRTRIGRLAYPQLFNAGVGGDKIENVLYRIDLGLIDLLKPHNPKLIVLHIGTNNLRPKHGLKSQQLNDYDLLLRTLISSFSTNTQILVIGLFKRTDVEEQLISQSNKALEELVSNVNLEYQGNRVHWLDLSNDFEPRHLQDHVHFNDDGYYKWNSRLYPKIQELLNKQ